MKAPLEHLESTTPMSASEGGLYILIAGALVGVGIGIGYVKELIRSTRKEKEDLQSQLKAAGFKETRSERRNNGNKTTS